MSRAGQMIETHPGQPAVEANTLAEAIDSCFECAWTCTACAEACHRCERDCNEVLSGISA
jgi:hypothetical protein